MNHCRSIKFKNRRHKKCLVGRRPTLVQPSSWGDAVGFVLELFGTIKLGKITENGGANEVRVDFRHPVDRVTSDDGQMSHANVLGISFLND